MCQNFPRLFHNRDVMLRPITYHLSRRFFVLLQLISLFTISNDKENLFFSSTQPRQRAGVNSEPIAAPAVTSSSPSSWLKQQTNHKLRPLPAEETGNVARLSDRQRFLNLLNPIAVPRVSGTAGIQRVKEFIAKTTLEQQLGYTIEYDDFEDAPPEPHAPRIFSNIIATLNPAAPRQLILACHYDSKYDRREQFVGACDSAVPCAMMLDIAVTLTPLLKDSPLRDSVTLQLIFFDGEEAFLQWSQSDSLYGSRHLAAKWAADPHPQVLKDAGGVNGGVNRLKGIDALVLLDLIGPRDVQFQNIFGKTNVNYQRLVRIERDLTANNEIKQWQDFGGRREPYFKPGQPVNYNLIDDDHRPFMEKGVPILHIISAPFPQCWHKYCDNVDNIHYETTDDILKILRVFVCEYLHCKP